jgi:hypothetical protein
MLSAITSYEGGLLWLTIIQAILAVLSVSAHKAWQYLIEGQRQRTLERMARTIPLGVEAKLQDRRSYIHVRSNLITDGGHVQGPPPDREQERQLADVVLLDTHRQIKPNESSWAPPA